MIRLAILSFWHVHAKDYVRDAANNPDTELVAAWDSDTERGRIGAEAAGVPFVESLDELLARDDIDGVIVTTPTTLHREVIPAAARAGKHVYTEKVLGIDGDEARSIAAAIDAAGVTAIVALRWLPEGVVQKTLAMIRDGELGDIVEARVRIAHNGAIRTADNPDGWLPERFYDPAEAAGGLMIDLGAHAMYLVRLMLGMPSSVSATYGNVTGRASEDQGVVTMGYPSGAIGVAGTSAAGSAPMVFEVFGTTGALRWDGPGTPLLRFRGQRGETGEPVGDVPDNAPIQFDQFVGFVQRGERNPDNIALAVDLSALAGAANESARTGRTIALGTAATGQVTM